MKVIATISLIIASPAIALTQNVGIGTTSPINKLQVMGSLLVTSTSTGTLTAPTPAQSITMSNGNTTYVGPADSTGRIYDPGGSSSNYINNLSSTVLINHNAQAIGIELKFGDFDFGTGDSLHVAYYDFSSSNPATGTYYFNAFSDVQVQFESNGDESNGRGFNILWRYIYSTGTDKSVRPLPGNAMYFDVSSGAFRAGALGNSPPGNFSIGMGVRTVATGEGAIALGNESKATGINSMAIGIYSEATGVNSICIGSGTAGGSGAVAIGNATSSGFYSVALGNVTLASGDYSTAMGNFTKAAGYAATAMGDYTRAIGTASTAMGDYTRAGGGSSTAMGNYTVANGYSGIAMGIYNDSIVSPQATVTQNTPLLIIGNGTDDLNRHNALVVRKNGHVGIGTNSPNAQLHIEGGIDAGFSDNSGYLIVGNEGATNIVFDDNEILARNNGTTSNLFLQSGGGRVIVGTSSGLTNSANIFDVNGTAGKPGGGTWATFSDERLKQDVKPYSEGLKNLLQINPVWFHYNSKSGYDTKPEYVEVLAQELQHAAPYMVTASPQKLNDGSAGYLQVDNSAMIYMLINAVKEQQQQIEGLKKQLGEKNDRQK